jgi:hypothetical protein
VPSVQIPENLLLLEKLGVGILRNVIVYDYYWRVFRNLKIRSIAEVEHYYSGKIPSIIKEMISVQTSISLKLLKIGVASKALMLIIYIRSLFTSTTS